MFTLIGRSSSTPYCYFLTTALPGSTMLGFDLRISTSSCADTDHRLLQIKIRRKKNVKKGIQFCLMVCGASGTGTSELPRDSLGWQLILMCRPNHFCEHTLRKEGPPGEGCRRRDKRTPRGRCQNQANYGWYEKRLPLYTIPTKQHS